ncbi:MAG: ABC transporter permease subunit [Gammaproteobacteria bacterium]
MPEPQSLWTVLGHGLAMVLCAVPLAALLGGPLGVLLYQLARRPAPAALARAVGAFCSIPSIVLLATLIGPIGGMTGAPGLALALAAIPCFARLVEHCLHAVPRGLIDAAQAMGASPLQIVTRVMLVETRADLLLALGFLALILLAYVALTGTGVWLLQGG